MSKIYDQIRDYCNQFQGSDKNKIIDGLMTKFNLKYANSQAYYYRWKKEMMNTDNCVPKHEKEPEKYVTPKKPREKLVIAEGNEEIEEKKATRIDKEEVKEFVAAAMEPKEEFIISEPLTKEAIEEIMKNKTVQPISIIIPDTPKKNRLKVKSMAGEYFDFEFTKDGVSVTSGDLGYLNRDMVEELTEALETYESMYLQ